MTFSRPGVSLISLYVWHSLDQGSVWQVCTSDIPPTRGQVTSLYVWRPLYQGSVSQVCTSDIPSTRSQFHQSVRLTSLRGQFHKSVRLTFPPGGTPLKMGYKFCLFSLSGLKQCLENWIFGFEMGWGCAAQDLKPWPGGGGGTSLSIWRPFLHQWATLQNLYLFSWTCDSDLWSVLRNSFIS